MRSVIIAAAVGCQVAALAACSGADSAGSDCTVSIQGGYNIPAFEKLPEVTSDVEQASTALLTAKAQAADDYAKEQRALVSQGVPANRIPELADWEQGTIWSQRLAINEHALNSAIIFADQVIDATGGQFMVKTNSEWTEVESPSAEQLAILGKSECLPANSK